MSVPHDGRKPSLCVSVSLSLSHGWSLSSVVAVGQKLLQWVIVGESKWEK